MELNRIINEGWFRELKATTGLSQSKFAQYFGITAKTFQKWELGTSKPPVYIPEMFM